MVVFVLLRLEAYDVTVTEQRRAPGQSGALVDTTFTETRHGEKIVAIYSSQAAASADLAKRSPEERMRYDLEPWDVRESPVVST